MKRTGGEIVVRALEDEDVAFCFGIPGTHNIELYDALAESETVQTVLVTDEQSASFMADAVWRASGRLACANVVPGAGLTHALSGIAEAWLDNVAMLVLACGIRRDLPLAFQLHDVDQAAIAGPVTKAVFRIEEGAELYATVRRACRLAREAPAGPVMVEVAANLYLFRHPFDGSVERDRAAAATAVPSIPATSVVATDPPDAVDADAVARASRILNESGRPLLYLGLGAAGAGDALVELAERLGAPVATTFQGKGVFPESHPLALWPGFGDAAPPFARAVARECDVTLAIGCRFAEVATGSYGAVPPGRLIHVDISSDVAGRNYEAAVAVVSDAARFVSALLPQLEARAPDPALHERIRRGHAAVRSELETPTGKGGVNPARLLRALQARLGADTVFTADSGNGTFLAMESLRLERPGRFLAPIDYSCMGYAVPGAVGASLACPESPVVALAGDGALLMTGLELLTAAAGSIPVAVFVLRDRELAQIAQFQKTAHGRKIASRLPDFDLERLSGALGVESLRLDGDDDVAAVVERVVGITGERRPVVVDVAIDYSRKTFFTRGVVRTNLLRLAWPDRL
ncbi:MAG: thiamine pyrophosphate-binding protein, partial [Gemmatimonadota bacterium]